MNTPYIVSARKYRPSTFASVVGQKALTATLKNAIQTGRLAHSYLFCGSRGVGKTSCARIFAKTINCEHPTPDGEACNECDSCRGFNDGNSLNIVELDAASNNGVDDIRQLVEQVQTPPSQGRYRVFIVDEVHMLSAAAFNAFLKTLEEPPSYVIFILATTEKHKIIPTILSRCQIYDFNRITIRDMVDHLAYVATQEGIAFEPPALTLIARKADGAMRDALSIFDQVAASSRGNITYQEALENLNVLDYGYYSRLTDCFLNGKTLESWLIYKEIRDRGFDSHFFITGLADYMRDLMVALTPQTIVLIEADDEVRAEMAKTAAKCSPQFIYKAMNLCNDADMNWRTATNKQFLVELTLAKICQLQSPSATEGGDAASDGGHLRKITNTAGPAPAATAAPAPQTAPQAVSQTAPATASATAPAPAPKTSPSTQMPAGAAKPPIPIVATGPAAPRKVVKKTATGTFSISRHEQHQASSPEAAQGPRQHETRDTPFTIDKLREAWQTFMDANPTRHILVNTLRASFPQQIEGFRYGMKVENEKQLEEVNHAMPEILAAVRDSLKNDLFTLAVELNQGEAAPHTWNDRQVLEHIMTTNPKAADFVSALSLTIA